MKTIMTDETFVQQNIKKVKLNFILKKQSYYLQKYSVYKINDSFLGFTLKNLH